MNRTLKRVLMISIPLLILPLGLEKNSPIPSPRSLTPEQIQYSNWLKYEGNKERRDPSYKFFGSENVHQTMQNENAYVRAVEERNYKRADSLWEYPDLDSDGIVRSR